LSNVTLENGFSVRYTKQTWRPTDTREIV